MEEHFSHFLFGKSNFWITLSWVSLEKSKFWFTRDQKSFFHFSNSNISFVFKITSNATILNKPGCCPLTGVEAVAGDVGALQPLGELVGEEDVAQFAVTVLLEELIVAAAQSQVSVSRQTVEIHLPHRVGFGGHGHHAARPARLQPVQEQHRQQEVTQVIDAKDHPEAVLRLSAVHQAWRQKHRKQ